MLKLDSIYKEYQAGDTTVKALKNIQLQFRKNEFVSILGPSGCGKTTMLNIIGGLDRYTSGDLSINGKSTKEFKDSDWDSYRNHSIGFVFQNYNLIPHQTVLANVELAMTLSGVSKTERRQRAIDCLSRVGLQDQINKKPTQMSGGQMQRVAIARALVNNPDILLADEPTGALDSETSVQIMEILKEIAEDKLIIMVTHNPELAEKYSTRIIRLFDGSVKSDSNPYDVAEASFRSPRHLSPDSSLPKKAKDKKTTDKTSMSMLTALSLSLNNLMTKKTRTFMTAFAGSIGIIGIALILSLSNGIQTYIDDVQKDTLSSYPITIEKESVDITSLVSSMSSAGKSSSDHALDKVYTNPIMQDMMDTMVAETKTNNLKAFKEELEKKDNDITAHTNAVQYGYNLDLNIYSSDTEAGLTKINPSPLFDSFSQGMSYGNLASGSLEVWKEMLDNQELLDSQYDMLAGHWPAAYNEVVLSVDSNNEISDAVLYALGLKDQEEFQKIMSSAAKGEIYEAEDTSYTYDELLSKTFKLVMPSDYYQYDKESNTWKDMQEDDAYMKNLVNSGSDIKIVGIIRPKEDSLATSMTGSIGYTSPLTEYVIQKTGESEIVKQQLADQNVDVFTGIAFDNGEKTELTMDDVNTYIATLDEETQAQTKAYLKDMTEEQILATFKDKISALKTDATYDGNLKLLGVVDLDNPDTINLYASTFEEKDAVADAIKAYNHRMEDAGKEESVINYTDLVGLMMSSVSSIINVITYVLIAFVGISLVVSSIMIGIITYISVLERTKEIGILRSIGASKKDISHVFNAETLIVGFVSGLLGIIITVVLNVPINILIKALSGISGVSASLPAAGGVILIVISMFLTLIGGFIPSKIAAKKDPVVALRSE